MQDGVYDSFYCVRKYKAYLNVAIIKQFIIVNKFIIYKLLYNSNSTTRTFLRVSDFSFSV